MKTFVLTIRQLQAKTAKQQLHMDGIGDAKANVISTDKGEKQGVISHGDKDLQEQH